MTPTERIENLATQAKIELDRYKAKQTQSVIEIKKEFYDRFKRNWNQNIPFDCGYAVGWQDAQLKKERSEA